MTARKLSISIPRDVAARMDHLGAGEVSPYVTEALRRMQAGDDTRETLSAAGFPEYPVDVRAAAVRATAAHISPEMRTRALSRAAALTGHPVEDLTSLADASAPAAGR